MQIGKSQIKHKDKLNRKWLVLLFILNRIFKLSPDLSPVAAYYKHKVWFLSWYSWVPAIG